MDYTQCDKAENLLKAPKRGGKPIKLFIGVAPLPPPATSGVSATASLYAAFYRISARGLILGATGRNRGRGFFSSKRVRN